jgi:hypothetical protein
MMVTVTDERMEGTMEVWRVVQKVVQMVAQWVASKAVWKVALWDEWMAAE